MCVSSERNRKPRGLAGAFSEVRFTGGSELPQQTTATSRARLSEREGGSGEGVPDAVELGLLGWVRSSSPAGGVWMELETSS